MIPRLADTLQFQTQALTLRAERQRLLASNIANADTPGYVARDLDFAAALREATAVTGGLAQPAAGDAAVAAERHLRYAAPSQTNLDGNSVDMDRERASFADNSRTLLDAMKSHHQG